MFVVIRSTNKANTHSWFLATREEALEVADAMNYKETMSGFIEAVYYVDSVPCWSLAETLDALGDVRQ